MFFIFYRAHKPICFLILSSALFFILYSDLAVSRTNLRSLSFDEEVVHDDVPIVRPNLGRLQLRSVHEPGALEELLDNSPEKLSPLIPPINVTEEERIAWFREKLPEFDIFKSDNSTSRFQTRVRDFLDSSCSLRFFMTWILPASLFGRRESLAVESLFRAHPDGCLVIVSRTLDTRRGLAILEPILSLQFKLLVVTPDLDSLLARTPAEAWYSEIKAGNRDPGEIPLAQNLSNLIRLAILYKYGGVYLDTDIIVLKDFSRLRNSIGAQSVDRVSGNWTRINNAVLVFDANHPLLFKFIQEFALTFDGNKWGHNGPYLASRVVRRLQGREGYNFTVLPPMAFYPVDWTRIRGFFKRPEQIIERKWVEAKLLQLNENTYGVHLWNKQSRQMEIEDGSFIERLISDHCIICRNTYSS